MQISAPARTLRRTMPTLQSCCLSRRYRVAAPKMMTSAAGSWLALTGAAFGERRLCAAIVDRLTFNGTIIETGTDSYRLAHTQKQRAGTVTTRV